MENELEPSFTLTEHLEEMRSRLFWSIIAWMIASCVCYAFVPHLLDFSRDSLLNKDVQLIFTRPTEAFLAYLKLAMGAGLFLASPVVFYHILMFISPGLKPSEKKWVFRLVPVSIMLFCTGVAFAFVFVLPITMHFFLSFQTESLNPMFQVGDFLGFITGILALCGASFQLPLLLFFASLAGIVTSKQLREGRRFAILLCGLVAAVVTPPDAFTMGLVGIPLWALYEASIIFIRFTGR